MTLAPSVALVEVMDVAVGVETVGTPVQLILFGPAQEPLVQVNCTEPLYPGAIDGLLDSVTVVPLVMPE